MNVYPYKMAPIFKEKIWGGRTLERLFDKPLPAGKPIGESWELADLSAGRSTIANGSHQGRTIRQILMREREAVLGSTPLTDGQFPLLLKLLDARQNLGVQVHPDAEAVKAIPDAALKTECWYVLASDGGTIYKGVRPGVTAADFRAALDAGNVAELLVPFEAVVGDFHYLPAGTAHALGAGVVVAEIQTPSDTTYRVFDWNRGREIHIERAMQCIHFAPPSPTVPGQGGECLLQTEYFQVYLRRTAPGVRKLTEGRCVAWMILSGRGRVRADGSDGTVDFAPGYTLLLAAALTGLSVHVAEPAQWLEVLLPPF